MKYFVALLRFEMERDIPPVPAKDETSKVLECGLSYVTTLKWCECTRHCNFLEASE